MSRYSDDDRERVRDAVDMVALVETRTELRRAGANSFFGRCPFHEERSGSFHVRPQEKHYHCFGCQASGDPFKFVMECEGIGFRESIEFLADRFSVKIEPIEDDPASVERRRQRERLLELLERTTAFYERFLWDSSEAAAARDLLRERGLSEETLRAYRVGYSPSAWDRVLVASREAGFSEQEIVDAGLASKARDRDQLFDRFRGRIMFPLADARGRVLGFGARAMRDGQGAKYLNSSDGPLYKKGRQLFGLDIARADAAKAGEMVLVEGYVDVLALHQAGVTNCVAIMGTSLTGEQVSQLERTAPTLLLALDADSAGQAAMVRAGRVASGHSVDLRVVAMPPGKDPGDLLLEEGPERLESRFHASLPFVEFRVDLLLSRADTSTAEGKDRSLLEIGSVLKSMPPSALRQELVSRIASQFSLGEDLVEAVISRAPVEAPESAPAEVSPAGGEGSSPVLENATAVLPASRQTEAERGFLALCLSLGSDGVKALAEVLPDEHFAGDLERRAARHILAHPGDPLSGLDPDSADALPRLMGELMSQGQRVNATPAALKLEALQLERLRLDREIARAQKTAPSVAGELAVRREALRGEIDDAVDVLEREAEATGR